MPPRQRLPRVAAVTPAPESARDAAKRFARSINARKGMSGTVVLASAMIPPPQRCSTGSLSFDAALGGGFPVNQWTEVIGKENSGKTTLVHKTVAHQQRLDPEFVCIWVASEPYDAVLAVACGVDLERVWLIESNDMEFVYDQTIDALESRSANMIVIDSYPALITTQEDDKDMTGVTMGGAKVTNQFFRKAGKAGKRSMTDPSDRHWTGILINQWREQIGVTHGDPRITPGGKGKNYAFYCRIDVSRSDWLADSDKNRIGQAMQIVVMKMKGAPPQQRGVTDFYFRDGNGFTFGSYDVFKALVSMAELTNVITRSSGNAGSFIDPWGNSYQGRNSLIESLRKDPEQQAEIERLVLAAAQKPGVVPVEPDVSTEEDELATPTPIRRRRGEIPA